MPKPPAVKLAWMYSDCVPEALVREIRDLAPLYAQAPNYWLPREALEGDLTGQMLTPAESAIWYLYHSVVKRRLSPGCCGAEWWVQVYDNGSGLAFHFDKDEHIYKSHHRMAHPDFSSVLYLTGSDEDRLRQGCTVILNQRFDSEKGTAVPESPTHCVFVPPSVGKYCLFDGTLGHGVLDASNPERRATLLVNWWKQRPTEIHRPTREVIEGLCANRAQSSALLCPSAVHHQPRYRTDIRPTAQSSYPVLRVPNNDAEIKESGILVDDLLDAFLLDAFGVNAVQAVSVCYDGHVLYPIDPTKTKQDISKKLIIPAAFVPQEVDVRR